MEPTNADDLGIVLDADGRPYDVTADRGWQPSSVRVDLIAELVVPGGELMVMDGNAVQVDPEFYADESPEADFGEHERLHLSFIVEQREDFEGEIWSSILGVRIDVEDTTVAGWSPFELAYITDGGVGGVVARTVIDAPDRTGRGGWLFDWDDESDHYLGDHDGVPGLDTVVFHNGYGDGGYPMSRGTDASGELVSLVIWDNRYPWRLAVPDGRPPADVTEREEQLIQCMAGTRLIDQWGQCSAD